MASPAAFRDLDGLAVGNLAFAVGRPGKSARASLRSIGVLANQEYETPRGGTLDSYIESDRQIPRGFGGGPLIDAAGAVIGLNTRTLVRNADLAVPTATLRRIVEELVAHGGIRRGYLGVGAYPSKAGALLAAVEDGGPAATGGLFVGDIISEIDGHAVDGPDSLRDAISDLGGKTVKVKLTRAGGPHELDVLIGTRS